MANHLYVVEMHTGRRWEPTVGVQLSREEGRRELAAWRQDNPGSEFRLTVYTLARAVR